MEDIQKINDYSVNLDLLLEQYKDSENLKGVIDASNDQADDLETALFEIRDLFYLDTATGVQLDIIGIIFSVLRAGLSDEDYREVISVRAALITSGEPESIITILKLLFEATFVDYFPAYPAGYALLTDSTININELEVFSPSGVQPYLLESLKFEDDTPIEFENGDLLFIV